MTPSPQTLGIIVGGLLPALFFGMSGFFNKLSTQAGIGVGPFLIIAGLALSLVGVAFHLYLQDATFSMKAGAAAACMGGLTGLGTGLVLIALVKFHMPLSKLAPLYNMNTLVAVLLSLVVFAEWQQVHVLKLLIGAFLVVLGGTLVALA